MTLTEVSVVIPTKNREKQITRAIESVIKQNEVSIELIIIDDASTDNTEEVIDYYRNNLSVKYLKNEESVGGAIARNQGASLATKEYLAFLDSDDEWKENHLKECLDIIQLEKSAGVFGNYIVIDDETNVNYNRYLKEIPSNLNMCEYILSGYGDTRTSTFFFKKNAFNKVKFDEKQNKHQDWDLAIRFDEKYEMSFNPEATVVLHEGISNRMSNNLNHEATSYLLSKHELKSCSTVLFKFYSYLSRESLLKDRNTIKAKHYRNKALNNLELKRIFNNGLKNILYFLLLYLPKNMYLKLYSLKNN